MATQHSTTSPLGETFYYRDNDGFLLKNIHIPIRIPEIDGGMLLTAFNMKPNEIHIADSDTYALVICKKGYVTIEACNVGRENQACRTTLLAGRWARVDGFVKFTLVAGTEKSMVVMIQFGSEDSKRCPVKVDEIYPGNTVEGFIDHSFYHYTGSETHEYITKKQVEEISKFGPFLRYAKIKLQVRDGPLRDYQTQPFLVVMPNNDFGIVPNKIGIERNGELQIVIPLTHAPSKDKLHEPIYKSEDGKTRIDHNSFGFRLGDEALGVIPEETHADEHQIVDVYVGAVRVTVNGEAKIANWVSPSLHIPAGSRHKIEQISPDAVKFMSIYEKV